MWMCVCVGVEREMSSYRAVKKENELESLWQEMGIVEEVDEEWKRWRRWQRSENKKKDKNQIKREILIKKS